MRSSVRLHVQGQYACFTRPEMKHNRISYDVMTPSAARGILEAIHWKPAIHWIIEEISVLKPIRFQSFARNEFADHHPSSANAASGQVRQLRIISEERRRIRQAQVLVDVEYVITARFSLTSKAGPEDTMGKHFDMFERRARKGQCFHQPSLGTREFPATFRLIEPGEELPPALPETRDLGFMLYDIDYAHDRSSLFFRASLDNGVMHVPPPGSRELCA